MPNPKDGGSTTPASNNLWVGNLTIDTTEADLNDLFRRYGSLDSVTSYSSRNYAFVHYKRLEDARKAKDSLQNALLRGNNIKIEFARPAKPSKNLWVGSISASVTKDQLENEFLKCGRIEEFKFLRDRNSALVEYYRLDDAVAAVKSMNGRRLGGEQIRVDFVKSSRRENLPDLHDSRDGNINNRSGGPPEPYWEAADAVRNFPESSHFGNIMHAPFQHSGGRREGPPSKVLWVGYPPSVLIDEQMLHNAMILFGEIERITSFPSRHFSFVEFRSVDEARRAKEGLQGRLFNDPRIRIMFSSSELAPPTDSPGFFAGISGPRPDMFFNEPNFGPGPLDFFGHRPMALNNFSAPSAFNDMLRPNMLNRPFGPQAGLDQIFSRPEVLNELAGLLNNFQEVNPNGHMVQNWRRPTPAPGLIPSPAQGMRPLPPIRPMPSIWEGSDPKVLERESKRLRIDDTSPFNGTSFPARFMDDNGIRGDRPFGFDSQFDRCVSTPVAQGQCRRSPFGPSPPHGETPDSDFCWRGIIAKGGTPVCHARCVPIGKGLNTQLPGIVNCSARTGLDMLAKHYGEASGFDIVFFLPDSEEDFASYTEFLRYLGAKNRAGVAKFDDGTTLFLIPPSDFLTKILNISGPERLYGVVLKLPQQKPSVSLHQQSNTQSLFNDRHHLPPLQTDHTSHPRKDDEVMQTNYSRISHEGAMSHLPKSPLPPTDEPPSMLSFPQDYSRNSASIPQSGLSLTPELIATLASLLPSGMQSSSSTSAQKPLGSVSWDSTSLPASVAPDQTMSSQGWTQGHQVNLPTTPNHSTEEQTFNHSQHFGYQFNSQAPYMSHVPAQLNVAQSLENSAQAIFGNSEGQDPFQNMAQQGPPSSRPANNIVASFPGGQLTVPQQANQQFQFDASVNPQKGYGSGKAAAASGVFHPPVYQQPKPSNTLSTQDQGSNVLPVSGMSSETDNVNAVLPDRVQLLQSALSGVGHGIADDEEEKNQRYQSTLQFAASLLLQIQQQQQGNTQAGNHHQ